MDTHAAGPPPRPSGVAFFEHGPGIEKKKFEISATFKRIKPRVLLYKFPNFPPFTQQGDTTPQRRKVFQPADGCGCVPETNEIVWFD